jgi:hypothetical protein
MASYAIIACRLPNGVMAEVGETRVRLNGANAENAVGGYGFTRVDESFADAWLKPAGEDGPGGQGFQLPTFKAGGLFRADAIDAAKAMARERSGERGGFERIDPDKPAPGMEPTDEMKKELAKAGDPDKRKPGRPPRAPAADA